MRQYVVGFSALAGIAYAVLFVGAPPASVVAPDFAAAADPGRSEPRLSLGNLLARTELLAVGQGLEYEGRFTLPPSLNGGEDHLWVATSPEILFPVDAPDDEGRNGSQSITLRFGPDGGPVMPAESSADEFLLGLARVPFPPETIEGYWEAQFVVSSDRATIWPGHLQTAYDALRANLGDQSDVELTRLLERIRVSAATGVDYMSLLAPAARGDDMALWPEGPGQRSLQVGVAPPDVISDHTLRLPLTVDLPQVDMSHPAARLVVELRHRELGLVHAAELSVGTHAIDAQVPPGPLQVVVRAEDGRRWVLGTLDSPVVRSATGALALNNPDTTPHLRLDIRLASENAGDGSAPLELNQ